MSGEDRGLKRAFSNVLEPVGAEGPTPSATPAAAEERPFRDKKKNLERLSISLDPADVQLLRRRANRLSEQYSQTISMSEVAADIIHRELRKK